MATARHDMSLSDLSHFLERELLTNVVPFWLRHAIDPAGGINTCIGDDGAIISHDKFLWSQWRAVYTFSALYNRMGRTQQWLDVAEQIFRFSARHGWDEQGRSVFRVDREGRPVEGHTSIYV